MELLKVVIFFLVILGVILFFVYKISSLMTNKLEEAGSFKGLDKAILNRHYYNKLLKESYRKSIFIGTYKQDINYSQFKNINELLKFLQKKEEEKLNNKIKKYKQKCYTSSEINEILRKDKIRKDKQIAWFAIVVFGLILVFGILVLYVSIIKFIN